MNKKPVVYYQTDPRWKGKPYRVQGESATIGGSGCGPTAAAMLIETLTGKTFTPVDACNWSMEHGYKALNQGTYYAYFKPQFAAFGIECDMLNWTNTYGKPDHPNHDRAVELLKQGYYLIALMNKGLWTSGGHFVVVWWQDGKVRINDPASSKDARLNGDIRTFRSQVKYYWWVDARKFNNEEETTDEEEDEVVRYERLGNVPEICDFRAIIDDLMTAGIIAGDGSDPKGNNDVIDLSHDMVRMLIFNYRAGVYDEAIRASGGNPDRFK